MNIEYIQQIINIEKGQSLTIINKDVIDHTITSISNVSSSSQIGEIFDSRFISPKETTTVNTSELEIGQYQFLCTLHPSMTGVINVK